MFERLNIGKIKRYRLIGLICFLCLALFSCSKNGSGTDGNNDDDDGTDDNIAPATIVDLQVEFVTTSTVTLSFTAPGDDGYEDWCYQCDFRGSYDSITAANFDGAYKINDIVGPFLGGSHQIWTLDSLESDSTYFFAFKTRDNMGNWSGLSNCVRAHCIQNQVITFRDDSLEAVIRSHLNRPNGDIWISDVDTIHELNGEDAGIVDLDGMQFFSELSMLHLSDNSIVDLTPLSGLIKLGALHLRANQFTSISPISGLVNLEGISAGDGPLANISPIINLTKLKQVNFGACQVTDFTPLQSLTELEFIYVANNQIGNLSFIAGLSKLKSLYCGNTQLSDISPLIGHADLEELNLDYNGISDISPLSGLGKLKYIALRSNQIVNIKPLVDNTGIGSGDQVYLQNNPLSDSSINIYIPALQGRGVTVSY